MAFELSSVVPWGRNLEEYKCMFNLSSSDLDKRIISFGDGPASFNFEMSQAGKKVVSVDPIYQFTKEQLNDRINETKDMVLKQTRQNLDNFVWKNIRDIHDLEFTRMSAMRNFLDDFDQGKTEGRYINHGLPDKLDFADLSFDFGLSSHFLILYSQLGLDFHIKSIHEMLRLCKEVRIFPLLNLNAAKSEVLNGIIEHFNSDCVVQEEYVDYEFQKGGNKMLTMKKNTIA